MAANLTQKDLAEQIGVSSTTISFLEKGKTQLSEEKIQKVAEILNCSVSEINITHPDNYAAHVDADNCIYIPYKIFSFGFYPSVIYMYAFLKKHMDPIYNRTPYMTLTHMTVASNGFSSPSIIHRCLQLLYTTNLITTENLGYLQQHNWIFPQDPDCFVIPANIISTNLDLSYYDIVIYMAIQALIQSKKSFSYRKVCRLCKVGPATVLKCLKHLTRLGYCKYILMKYFCYVEKNNE